MSLGHYAIDRPRFAAVVSIVIVIVGVISYLNLPVAQYPEIAPPTIVVRAVYPGATPETIAETVAAPLEQEVNGVEDMLYMTSSATSDGSMQLTITFALGTDLDNAQVLVQNRVAIAEPRLPEDVRRLGIVTQKSSPDLMILVHLDSPDDSLDQLYISNYALLQIRDVVARIDGVGSITVFGAREYSMRVWLDPDHLAAFNLTPADIVAALRGQNVEVAGGQLGQPPMPLANAFQLTVNTRGRLLSADEFGDVIVKTGADGRVTRLREIARIELGAREYTTNSYLHGKPAVAIAMVQRPGSNALETAAEVKRSVAELAELFPEGLSYQIVYNPTEFIEESVHAVYETIFEAAVLVVIVILLFLQRWRAALIPIIAIPVSLIGTFAVMAVFGFSLNNLTLFGLVLAIGIVVDDAIVVVENIERNLERGLGAHEAARVTMDEVGGALISIALVLGAVFVPTAFLGGISGQFFRQFALTIAVATAISAFNSLTLSPALGAILLKPGDHGSQGGRSWWDRISGPVFRGFNYVFDAAHRRYGIAVCKVVRHPIPALAVFVLLLGATFVLFKVVPGGFIPQQDQGYLVVAVDLPKGASLERTDAVIRRATELAKQVAGVEHVVGFAGFSGATFSAASNGGLMFINLTPYEERGEKLSSDVVLGGLMGAFSQIRDAQLFVLEPAPVRGVGTGGGFKMMVQDRSGHGLRALEQATWALAAAANQSGDATRVFTTFGTDTPQYSLQLDRTKAEMLGVPVQNVFDVLSVYMGSAYVNDISLFGRTYRVTAQADAPFRMQPVDIERLRVRNSDGGMVPLGTLVNVERTTGPDRVVRHNLYPSAELQGSTPAGNSSGETLIAMERLADEILPPGIAYEWTELAYQERTGSALGLLIFPLSVVFVFLVLTAQYESWSLPLAIVLIVPLCLFFAFLSLFVSGLQNDILAQIGFVVLIALACKNAILIVEFAKQHEDAGSDRFTAATEAAQLRLRPILMTSFAFILGVLPLVLASGPGSEMRNVLGTTVFGGMLGVTIVGLFMTPVFYVVIRGFVTRRERTEAAVEPAEGGAIP
jgi:HAE1 family hydrophobic/amphiphilic exporter-1